MSMVLPSGMTIWPPMEEAAGSTAAPPCGRAASDIVMPPMPPALIENAYAKSRANRIAAATPPATLDTRGFRRV